MVALTRDMALCLAAIRRLTVDGAPPSLEELRLDLGLASKSGVHVRLAGLRDRGVLSWTPGCSRSIVIHDDRFTVEDLGRMSDDGLVRLALSVQLQLEARGDQAVSGAIHMPERRPGQLRQWLEAVAEMAGDVRQRAIDWMDDLDAGAAELEDDEREICSEDDQVAG